jgi:hypothetical protein
MQSIITAVGIGRAYRVRWLDRIILLFVFVFAVIVTIAAGTYGLAPAKDTPPWLPIFGLGLMAIITGIATLSSFYNRVTLYANSIEYRSIWSTSWLQFEEIRGRRALPGYGGRGGRGPRLRIVPNEASQPTLEFEKNYNFDDAFWTWFNKLTDLSDRTS